MNYTIVVVLAGLPALGYAQTPTQVPAIVPAATASAAAAVTAAPPAVPTPALATKTAAGAVAAMPPAVHLLSPSAPLDAKERHAVFLARRWRNRAEMPQRGEDGVVRFLYGATLPTIVCAPLQVCNLALQPGEIVHDVEVGDSVRWKISPSISGNGSSRTTHLIVKPVDAGLVTSLDIATDRRTYAIKLVSTRSEWMPLVAFNYPDDMQRQWAAYRQAAAFGAAADTLPTGENVANLDFGFQLSGDDPPWRPVRVYTDGAKTYIEFPRSIGFSAAPALVALDSDGGWFASGDPQMVNYRMVGDRYVVDRVLDHAELISGVGSGQTRVVITRHGAR
ncbi:MAG TPA: P-type conjugative transfer protein TrbG [Stellaceae bacterium]